MANFGIAEELVVITESARNGERTRCRAQRSTLSVTESCIDFETLPSQGAPSTEVIAEMQPDKHIAVAEAVAYISAFVAYVWRSR
jgi:molecular chaperone HtpG